MARRLVGWTKGSALPGGVLGGPFRQGGIIPSSETGETCCAALHASASSREQS